MSIQSEIERINENVSAAYSAVEEKGGSLPEQKNSDNLAGAIQGIPSGGKEYTAGDGISIDDDVISVTNPNQGIVTQAEFERLTDEQKNKGTWLILDENDQEAMANANIYSMEETVIGRWIDGKPIYRKVLYFDSISNNSASNRYRVVGISNVDRLVNRKCAFDFKGSSTMFYQSDMFHTSVDAENTILFNQTISPNSSIVTNTFMCFEYTKTTDDPAADISGLASAQTETATPSVSKSGKVTHDGVEYDYVLPDDAFSYASASASSAHFGLN